MPTSPRAKDYVIALLRSGIQGGAVDIAGGLTGLARMPREGLEGFNAAMEQADTDMGYHPQGAELQALQNIGEFLSPVTEPIGQAVDAVGESNPALGAMLRASPAMLPLAGKAGRLGKTILEEELRRPSGSKSAQRGHFRLPISMEERRDSISALRRLQEGALPKEVWRETGWGILPGTAQVVREVSDANLKIRPEVWTETPEEGARIIDRGRYYSPEELFSGTENMSHLKGLSVAPHNYKFEDSGYSHKNNRIDLSAEEGEDALVRQFLHEYQHHLQTKQGMPTGTMSPELSSWEDIGKILRGEMENSPELYSAGDNYWNNHGEAIARLAVSRKDLSPEELRNQYPFEEGYFQDATYLPTETRLEDLIQTLSAPDYQNSFRYFDYTNEPSESRTRARKALKHLDNGTPAAEIWREYGWGREPVTNQLITEISDSRLDVPSNKLYRGPDGSTLLFGAQKGDTGDHLLKDSILQGEAYLKYLDPNYRIRGNPQKNLGAATHYAPFATESGLIEMGPQASYADFMDTLVHELNHGMQSRFGAPRGGSPEQFGYKDFEKKYFDADEEYRNYIEALKGKLPPGDAQEVDLIMSEKNLTPEHLGRRDGEIIHRAGRLLPDPEIQRALTESLRALEQKKLFKSEMREARKKYENLHGEAMSRLAQNRRNLDPQLIRALYPFEPKYFKQQTGSDIGELDVKGVGRASSGEDTLKFLDTTGLPLIEEARKSPAYSRLYKGVEVEDVEMTPDEFLDQATGGGMAYDTSWIDYDKLDRLRGLDEAGTAVDRPALFRYDPEAYWPDQHEGRHRALIAEEGGAEKIPVTIYREGLSKDPDLWSKVLSGEISEQDALLELLKRSQK